MGYTSPGSHADKERAQIARTAGFFLRHLALALRLAPEESRVLAQVPPRALSGLAIALALHRNPRPAVVGELEPRLLPFQVLINDLSESGALPFAVVESASLTPVDRQAARELLLALRSVGIPLLASLLRLAEVQAVLVGLHERFTNPDDTGSVAT